MPKKIIQFLSRIIFASVPPLPAVNLVWWER